MSKRFLFNKTIPKTNVLNHCWPITSILDFLVSRSSLFNDVAACPGRDPGTGPACRRWGLFENQNSKEHVNICGRLIRFLELPSLIRLNTFIFRHWLFDAGCSLYTIHELQTILNTSSHFVYYLQTSTFSSFCLLSEAFRVSWALLSYDQNSMFQTQFRRFSCSWFASRLSASPRSILTIFMFLGSIRLTPPVLADLCNKPFLRAGAQSSSKHHVIVN